MLKSTSILVTALTLVMLTVSCKSKPKVDPGPAGGVDGAPLDSSISSEKMPFTNEGSDSGKIPGLSTVRFDYDSSTLSTDARRQLAENANWIKANSTVTVQIEGHCDARGSVEYNLALGERRAKAVKNYMVSLGIDSKRLSILSYGEERPINTGESEEAYAQNRRANFVPIAQ